VVLALVALFASAASASAQDVRVHGSLLVRWQSNPATCEQQGLCSRWGTLAWNPTSDTAHADSFADAFSFLDFFESRVVARSYRADGETPATCIDNDVAPVDIRISAQGRGRVVFSMRDFDEFSFGRCAGPLGRDFALALPQSKQLSRTGVMRGGLVDLRARTPFSSGPFEGEVVSTLTVRQKPERAESGSDDGSTEETIPKPRPGRLVRYGSVGASYAIERLAGDAGYDLRGMDGECSPFDTCGMTGDLMVHADVHEGTVRISSTRSIPLGSTETAADGLAALRRGGTHVYTDSTIGPSPFLDVDDTETPFSIPFTATATPRGGETCNDSGKYLSPILGLRRTRAGLLAWLTHGGNSTPDALRTRCPGPGSDTVRSIGSALIPIAAVGRERIELTLRPEELAMAGLRGSGRGELQLTLRRTSLRATSRTTRIEREVEP
jgi:hypothetical protein